MKKKIFIALNIVIPLFIGAILYYFMSPETIFVEVIDRITGQMINRNTIPLHNALLRFVRFYFLDMCWAYALTFSLHAILGNNTADLKKSFLITTAFSCFTELLQLTPVAKGTFDILDIICEVTAGGIAVFIIKNMLMRRQMKNEKEV